MLKRACHLRALWVISTLITVALSFTAATKLQGEYAGSQACAGCHKNIYDDHIHTAHFNTSAPANEQNVKGSFSEGRNTFLFDGSEHVTMEKRQGRLYQVDYIHGKENMAQPFDITTGSGKRGQTYLYWEDNKLFQLPISWFTPVGQWTNSPGYINKVRFNRPITSRCLECYSTRFERTSGDQAENDEFSKTGIIYGVDCERCHGPGARHTAWHKDNPKDTIPRFIINTNKLTRQQNLDLCRLCHGGGLVRTSPSFSFLPGDSLSRFFEIPEGRIDPRAIDVHGNQYGMLAASKCFEASQMTCISCHDPHKNEEGMLAEFSTRCMNCHNPGHNTFCKLKNKEKYNIAANCIDCHMPELTSKAIMVMLQGDDVPTPASMRTHFIKVYPEETKKFLKKNTLKRIDKI